MKKKDKIRYAKKGSLVLSGAKPPFFICGFEIKKTKKGGEIMEKKRVVIELDEEDYRALLVIKAMAGLEWKDLLIAGGLYLWENTDLKEKAERIEEKIKQKNK